MDFYTDYNKMTYMIGVVDCIINMDSKELSVDTIKNLLKGAKSVIEGKDKEAKNV